MKKTLSLTLFFCCIFNISLADNDVVVKDLKLFVNSQEFFIKAISYNPVPLGAASESTDDVGGGGFCSNKETPYGDYKSACYDSDYFDGSPDAPGRVPPGPSDGGWFQQVWERDFPILQALGVNTLRLYNANPTTRMATQLYTNIIPFPYGKNHTAFMDYAEQMGFKIVFPLIGDESLIASSSMNEYKRYISWQIDEIGNHPALLMFTLGNELPLDSDATLLNQINEYIGYARSYMQLKWGRNVPITSAVVDLPNSYDYLAANLDVDVFTTNAGYRGISFTNLWSGDPSSDFSGWSALSCRYNKPVFIGEIGWQSQDNEIMESIPNWFNQIWLDAINHIDQGCIGGSFFEYSDEPLKAAADQQTMGVVSLEVNEVNGVSSTATNAWLADTAVLKEIFAYVANGTFNGIQSNMNADVFSIIGRQPYTLSTLPISNEICVNFTSIDCPSSSTVFDCSGHGTCDYNFGDCLCSSGWNGSDCSVAICAGSSTCSGDGTCISVTSPPICNCDAGEDGDYCQTALVAQNCPIGSGASTACGDGNGICDNTTWTCSCIIGWSGTACTIANWNTSVGVTPSPNPSSSPSPSPSSSPSPSPSPSPSSSPPTSSVPASPNPSSTSTPTKAPTSSPTATPGTHSSGSTVEIQVFLITLITLIFVL